MSRHSEIKKTVLRGVYEDNAGIPRSTHGKRQSKFAADSQEPVHSSRYPGKAVLVAVLGLVALLGFNLRLVTVDVAGPAAMQVVEEQPLPSYRVQLPVPVSPVGALIPGNDQLVSPEPIQSLDDATITSGRYDTMLTRLGMPMADLFNLQVQTIVIDPGHGGIDPGATGHLGLKEKDVVLDIAKRLRDKLAVTGKYRVLLTREGDRKVFLKERVAFAKENRADLFISTHVNSLPPGAGSLNYVETYYFGPHTDQRSLELAEKENRDSDYAMGDFREVIARIGDTLKTEESKQLANSIHKHLYNNMKRRNRGLIDAGAKTGPFMVLLGVEVPSVLIEVSCISNKAEEARLSTPEYRDRIADYLKTGIVDYLEERAHRRTIEGGIIQNVAKQER
ncbi:MAG: N-acetylmuramoyl-L-alanine amidase [Gammaproteobacteria bacterium]|nr:MAG: N-acetylmuramoyl-L-alanine amidase [Gammaproteobacteria bacterium]